ncbi:VCBS repeat-containing protein [Streptomyces somaliensis]|uniref:VCBS repeat-containing protein n=1 Tax=Streptomyces somaliensis TaxID=78355 RepID=UPI0034E946C1|nr:VCBS repeat-containing protein [Streptomyces somaliensis]
MCLVLALGAGAGQPAAAAEACVGGVDSDFNGDGLRDMVIADPQATVGGIEKAGQLHVVLGGGKGTVQVHQSIPNVSDGAEPGDQFGFSLAVYDANQDGCSDLAVGIPYEDVGTTADAGLVHLIFGSTLGIGQGTPDRGFRHGAALGETSEPEDWVGYAVATTRSATGVPYLVVGAPGEDVSGKTDSGLVSAVYGTDFRAVSFDQDSPGVWEEREAYDQFGSAIVATGDYFVVGVPGESVDTDQSAGVVMAFRTSLNTDGIPAPSFGMGQLRAAGSEKSAETGDRFGTSMAFVPYRHSSTSPASEFLLAVGVPGEDLADVMDAGAVQTYQISATGGVTALHWIDQNTTDVEGEAEPGDFFGQSLAGLRIAPDAASTGSNTRLAVGAPGEESTEEHLDKGGVHILPFLGAPGTGDNWVEPGIGIPSPPASRQLAGMSLGTSEDTLLVGMPYGPAGGHAVHGYKQGSAHPLMITTWKPGHNGIPTGDAAFGAVVR